MQTLLAKSTTSRNFKSCWGKLHPEDKTTKFKISGTILIIEDHVGWRLILKYLLQDRCDEIVTFGKAEDAYEYLCKSFSNISLILSDIDLPGISGLELLDKLKCQANFSKIPVILQSGCSEFYKARGMLLGASAFLTKPYTKELLYSAIEKIFNSNSTNTSSEGLNVSFSFKGSHAQQDRSTGKEKEHITRSNKSKTKIGG